MKGIKEGRGKHGGGGDFDDIIGSMFGMGGRGR